MRPKNRVSVIKQRVPEPPDPPQQQVTGLGTGDVAEEAENFVVGENGVLVPTDTNNNSDNNDNNDNNDTGDNNNIQKSRKKRKRITKAEQQALKEEKEEEFKIKAAKYEAAKQDIKDGVFKIR